MRTVMRKLSVLLFLFSFALLWSENPQDDDSGFYLKVGIGADVRFGVVTENYYRKLSDGTLYRISWLTWETLPAVSAAADASFGYQFRRNNSIDFNAFLTFAIPSKTGKMQDYDAQKFDGRLTDYSCHDNYTNLLYSTGFYADWAFFHGLGFGVGFEYEKASFSGNNGYAQHYNGTSIGYWSEDLPVTSYYDGKTIITYEVMSFYWKPGIVWRHSFESGFSVSADIWNYLYRYNRAQDVHYKFTPKNVPDDYYTDIIEVWFKGFEARASVGYAFTKKFSLLLKVKGTYLPDEYGDDYFGKPPNAKLNINYKGGLSAWSASASLSAIFQK